jgi:hypothetical protein
MESKKIGFLISKKSDRKGFVAALEEAINKELQSATNFDSNDVSWDIEEVEGVGKFGGSDVLIIAVVYEYPRLYVGDPPVNVQMYLFSDTPLISEINQSFKTRIRNVLKDAVIEEIPIDAFQHREYFRDWRQQAIAPSHDVHLMDMDEYFLNGADLAEMFICIDNSIYEDTIVQKAIDKGKSRDDGKLYLIPRYIDIGLWANRDVLEEYGIEAPITWTDVLYAARKILQNPDPAKEIIGTDKIRMLDFGGLAPESINCVFIEALYNNGGGIWRNTQRNPKSLEEDFNSG